MLRLTIFVAFLAFIWAYAFREWMVSLCGLILLTVLMNKDDMPAYLAGVPGLNPWNATLVVVTLGWLWQRQRERHPWNVSKRAIAAIVSYIGVIVLAYAQAMLHTASFPPNLTLDPIRLLTVDHLLNPLKFIWVALLFAEGCNSPRRLRLALGTVIALGVFYALMVIKVMPLESLVEGTRILRYRNRIHREIGLHASNQPRSRRTSYWARLTWQSASRRRPLRSIESLLR